MFYVSADASLPRRRCTRKIRQKFSELRNFAIDHAWRREDVFLVLLVFFLFLFLCFFFLSARTSRRVKLFTDRAIDPLIDGRHSCNRRREREPFSLQASLSAISNNGFIIGSLTQAG